MTSSLARVIVRRPALVLGVLVLAVAAAAAGIRGVSIDRSLDAMMLPNDPNKAFVEGMKAKFGSDEILVAALVTDEVFTPRVLGKVVELTRELAKVDGVDEVKSLATANHIEYRRAQAGSDEPAGIAVGPLFERIPQDPGALAALRAKALADPLFAGNLVSADARATAFVVYLRPDVDRDTRRQYAAAEAIESVAERFDADGDRVYLSGVPANKVANARMSRQELRRLLPLLLFANATILALAYRSVRGFLLPVAVMVLALVIVLGAMGHAGIPLNTFTNYVPLFVIMLSSTYAVYGVTSYFNGVAEHDLVRGSPLEDKRRALAATLERYGGSLLTIVATTAVGFGSLLANTIPATRELGLFTAVGVVALFPLCGGLLYAAFALLPLPRKRTPRARERPAQWLWAGLAHLAVRRPWAVVGAWAALVGVMVWGASLVRVSSNALAFLPYDHPLRVSEREIASHLGSTGVLNVFVQAGARGAALEPAVLERAARLQRFAEDLDEVDRTISLIDYFEPFKAALDAEAADGAASAPAPRGPSGRLLPHSAAEAAEMAFVYPYPRDLERFLDQDKATLRIVLRMNKRASADLNRVQALVEAEGARLGFEPGTVHAASTLLLFGHAFDSVVEQMRSGLITSLLIVLPMLILFTRSARTGLLAILPNVAPVVCVLGFMGHLRYPLDFSNSTIAAITIGIAVDDTVHFLAHFRGFRALGHGTAEAVRRTLQVAGPSMAFTTGVLAVSLLTFNVSEFTPTRNLGQIAAFGFGMCLLADLTLLPALLVLFSPRSWKGEALPAEEVAARLAEEDARGSGERGLSGEWARPSHDG